MTCSSFTARGLLDPSVVPDVPNCCRERESHPCYCIPLYHGEQHNSHLKRTWDGVAGKNAHSKEKRITLSTKRQGLSSLSIISPTISLRRKRLGKKKKGVLTFA